MSEKRVTSTIKLEGARLIFRNFSGKKSDYNEEGNRNFGVLLEEELAEALIQDGWRVRRLKPKADDPDMIEQPWLSVKVKFEPYPPIIYLITDRGKRRLDEETVDQLDWSRIANCDLIIRPYNYPALAGRPAGVAAYLKAMYVRIEEDDLAKKYGDIPDLDERYDEDDEEELPFK